MNDEISEKLLIGYHWVDNCGDEQLICKTGETIPGWLCIISPYFETEEEAKADLIRYLKVQNTEMNLIDNPCKLKLNKLVIVNESHEDYSARLYNSSKVDLIYQMNLMREQLKEVYKNE